MGGWIGTLGNLAEFKCPSRLSVSQARERTWFTGLDSTDTVIQAAGFAQRTWAVDLSTATPGDLAVFDMIQAQAFGLGPFKYVDPWSANTNLLTPAVAGMTAEAIGTGSPRSNLTQAVMTIPGAGRVPAGIVAAPSSGFWGYHTPVNQQKPVTLSLMVQGQATVNLLVMRQDWTHRHVETTTVNAATPQRVSLTFNRPYLPDAEMCGIQITTTSSATIAQPQITWTDGPVPWAPGAGVSGVVIDSYDKSIVRASGHQLLADAGVTLMEVRDHA